MIGKSLLWMWPRASACLALLVAMPGHAQQFTEVQVSSAVFGDIEFDSARDGAYCPTCNFGQGNSRFNWTDRKGNLWLGHIDWSSGAFTPANGKAELVDTNAAFWKTFGNGPEWAFSQQGSQLMEISAAVNLQSGRVPSRLAVTNIDPAAPMFTLLTDANSPPRVRSDPEYFISANGPCLYYGRSTLASSSAAAKGEGEFYIDMQLGPPTGLGGTAE